MPCNLETLQSQQIFALPFPNDNVSKPSWVCPAHFVLITVPFLPLKFATFFQSKHVNSISLISEADEVQLTSLRKEETRFGHTFFAIKLKFHSTSKAQPMNVETASSISGSSITGSAGITSTEIVTVHFPADDKILAEYKGHFNL